MSIKFHHTVTVITLVLLSLQSVITVVLLNCQNLLLCGNETTYCMVTFLLTYIIHITLLAIYFAYNINVNPVLILLYINLDYYQFCMLTFTKLHSTGPSL